MNAANILMYSDKKYKFCVYHENENRDCTLYALMETEEEAITLSKDMILNYCNDIEYHFYPAEIIRITYDITTIADQITRTVDGAHSRRLTT
jgi:hypothetical protein